MNQIHLVYRTNFNSTSNIQTCSKNLKKPYLQKSNKSKRNERRYDFE